MSNPHAISPLDGRYYSKTRKVAEYFSEFAFCKYRIKVELEYFYQLVQLQLPELQIPNSYEVLLPQLENIANTFDDDDFAAIKLVVEASGAVENLTILEAIDFGKAAAKASKIGYKAPGQ